MKVKAIPLLLAAALVAPAVHGADILAGRAKAAAVCGTCHGVNGASVSDNIPNLAAQRPAYIENQLRAFREGGRRPLTPTSPAATMAAIAAQLTLAEISDIAAYYASLPPVGPAEKSAPFPNVAKTHVTFPDDYKQTFVKYHTINFPATKQVRYYWANKTAIQAAQQGKPAPAGAYILAEVYSAKLENGNPVTGPDGFFVAEKPLGYTAMATGAGWGRDIPEMLKNADWNYALYSVEKQQRPMNHGECLGCHKPLSSQDYLFTIKQLAGAGAK